MYEEIPLEPKEMEQKTIVKYACCVTNMLSKNRLFQESSATPILTVRHLSRECLDVLAKSLDRLERYGVIQRCSNT